MATTKYRVRIWAIIWLLLGPLAHGAEPAMESAVARVEHAFYEAQALFNKNPANPESAWQFAVACFDWADLATSNSRRAPIAEQGIAACRQALQRDPKLAPAHYYLAMNLGQLAR